MKIWPIIVISLVGFCLLAMSFVFMTMHWVGIYPLRYSGIAMIFLAVLLIVIKAVKDRKNRL
jgi:hypothetical protein